MDRIRELSKSFSNFTLFLVVIGTVVFVGFAFPYLNFLNGQGQLLEGLGLFLSGLGLLLPLGTTAYGIKQSELERSEGKLDDVSLQFMQYVVILALTNQEALLRENKKLEAHKLLKASELTSRQIRALIPPILMDRADILMIETPNVAEQIDFRRNIAQHLEKKSEELKYLAVEAADEILDKLNEEHLKRLNLYEPEDRNPFIGEIYKYLRVWLKSSIEYDMPMPEENIHQTALDRKLYIDTLENIRDNKIDKFGLKEEKQEQIIRKYLNILIVRLDKVS
jgi:hypothetical protein